MSDTQWPRFEVFVQERETSPHQNVGSVHAADVEMAIQNARDVFVRRPNALNLWVVPAADILMRTTQEIEADSSGSEVTTAAAGGEGTYYVFQKSGQRRAMVFVVHVGQVEAETAEQALQLARQQFSNEDVYVWWVFPAAAVAASKEEDIESMFAPALDKAYRMPNQYRTITQMMEVRKDE